VFSLLSSGNAILPPVAAEFEGGHTGQRIAQSSELA